jgi:hypothetical protein
MGLLVILGVLLEGVGYSQDRPKGMVSVYGSGAFSCGRWVADQQTEQTQLDMHFEQIWVLGYVSGAGAFATVPLADTDANAIKLWIDNYCQAHPLDRISIAARQLAFELVRRAEQK